eukprot:22976-Eustigmatos_ZCMA.PRE.1
MKRSCCTTPNPRTPGQPVRARNAPARSTSSWNLPPQIPRLPSLKAALSLTSPDGVAPFLLLPTLALGAGIGGVGGKRSSGEEARRRPATK